MNRYSNGRIILLAVGIVVAIAYLVILLNTMATRFFAAGPPLLTDPFLQNPTPNSAQVVWFTEFEGRRHLVEVGDNFDQTVTATTRKLSRMFEDQKSRVGEQTEDGQLYASPTARDIWRHEATVEGLTPGMRTRYRVVSIAENGRSTRSNAFSLTALPEPGSPLKILLTSDHQSMPMTPANLQKVEETIGQVDAIFLAGDLVNIPDRASEWFDDNRNRAFFPSLQGRAAGELETEDGGTEAYRGGRLIQSAPLFAATGNHEVMGRWSMETELNEQFNDPVPRAVAEGRYVAQEAELNPTADPAIAADWIRDQSFNTISYDEIFSMPQNEAGNTQYYAVTVGDVRLIVLYATNIWRTPNLNARDRGRYRERDEDLIQPENWGFGQHIFEPIRAGSEQYTWLQAEVQRPEFTEARYRVVMFHHPAHSLGDNIVPAYTDPVQLIDYFEDGNIKAVRYEYPKQDDYLIRDVTPLLEAANTNLVLYGHSHVWNRFVSPNGTYYLETSNVGNTYDAYVGYIGNKRRPIPIGFQEDYRPTGDPNGLEPVVPTIAPTSDEEGNLLPYLASNDLTAFTILDTGTGVVSSYYFNTKQPTSGVVKFDEFSLIPSVGTAPFRDFVAHLLD